MCTDGRSVVWSCVSDILTQIVSLCPTLTAYPVYLFDCATERMSITVLLLLQEYTNYHFEVAPEALHEALDRFAQFFISPLCKADSLEREVRLHDPPLSLGALVQTKVYCELNM